MTLVLNHQPQLNGSKFWLSLVFGLIILQACAPKLIPQPVKKPVTPLPPKKEVITLAKKFTEANISLLIPFNLNLINLKTAAKADVEQAALAVDFYQGVKLGIDSAATLGLNFKLNVFDVGDDIKQMSSVLKNESLKNSNLIIGPVYPSEIKDFTEFAKANQITLVSPLAATKPSEFNNPNLISVVNNIDQHAEKIGRYIYRNYNNANTVVVIISDKKPTDEQFATPLRAYFKEENKLFLLQEYVSVNAMATKMIKNKRYVVVLASSEHAFVRTNIDVLVKLKNLKTGGYVVNLFGHPNWVKQNYNTEKLQSLNTIVSASYFVNYKSFEVIAFVKKYRQAYSFEPSEYSFKGFDVGLYFGKLLAIYGAAYLSHLSFEKYYGLHNNFTFVKDANFGYINTSLMLLNYKNNLLNVIR